LKLLNYSVNLSDHVYYQKKSEYLNLMENFVNLKINGKEFVSQFNKTHRTNQETIKVLKTDLKQLNTFQPNPKSFGFTEWISEIDLGCDEFYSDFDSKDSPDFPFAKNEDQFRTFIADIIPQIQKYFYIQFIYFFHFFCLIDLKRN